MIVGLMGPAGSGKDTVADQLVEKYGFVRVGLADEIKRTAKRWWDFTDEQLWGPSEFRNASDERYPIKCQSCGGGGDGVIRELACGTCEGQGFRFLTPRHALQQLGSELSRSVDPDVWCRVMLDTAKQILENGQGYSKERGLNRMGWLDFEPAGVVVSDCRFRNELECIQKASGRMCRIYRQDPDIKDAVPVHVSELELRSIPREAFEYNLDNFGTLDELAKRVDRMMAFWTEGE